MQSRRRRALSWFEAVGRSYSFSLYNLKRQPVVKGRNNGERLCRSPSEGSAIQDYVVEDHANHELGAFKTQKEAIDWARSQGHSPLVARVRHLNDKKKPNHWRSA